MLADMLRTLDDIRRLIVRELDAFDREIALFPDDRSIWTTPPGITNSAGNLALHVAGNLRYCIGAVLGGDGYVRNREAEFSRKDAGRAEVRAELAAARTAVDVTLPCIPDATLAAPFPVTFYGHTVRADMFLLHLVAHTAFHLGQAGYVRRVVTGDPQSANPLPLDALSN
jgi:hypothetical protein